MGVKKNILGSGLCGFYLDIVKTIVIDNTILIFRNDVSSVTNYAMSDTAISTYLK